MRIPDSGRWEVLLKARGDAGCSKESMCRWYCPVCAVDMHGRLDLSHDAVNGRMDAEGLLDTLREERKTLDVFVCQVLKAAVRSAKYGLLLFVELLDNLGLGSCSQEDEGHGGGR